tara:strand:+ start:840 stop:1547 length:708 start_codon:yes stop_codon:yes gene_type:complete
MKSKNNNDYVEVIYNEKDRPFTTYPGKLAKYLFNRYDLKKGQKLLDVGCGRGEFLKGFIDCGLDGYAVDQSETVLKYLPDSNFKKSDIENQGIPYPDNFFDIVYSKSVIEHFFDPDKLIREVFRILKPGGLVITLCPSWEHNYKIYFEDYTHRSPFMIRSLKDIKVINGFNNIEVEFFRQLPFLWQRKKFIIFAEMTRLFLPDFLYTIESNSSLNKWIRFSKEIMILASARKPLI